MKRLLSATALFGAGVFLGFHWAEATAEQFDPCDEIPELEPGLYEECPDCPPRALTTRQTSQGGIAFELEGGCTTCWDLGLIPHTH